MIILRSLLSFIGAQASKLGAWAINGNYMFKSIIL